MNQAKILVYLGRAVGISLFLLPLAFVGAEGDLEVIGKSTGIIDPLGNKTVPQVLNTFLNALIQIGVVVIVLSFMWAGFKFVTAMGQEKQISEAKSIFFNTVIGAAILLGARVIATVVETTIKSI